MSTAGINQTLGLLARGTCQVENLHHGLQTGRCQRHVRWINTRLSVQEISILWILFCSHRRATYIWCCPRHDTVSRLLLQRDLHPILFHSLGTPIIPSLYSSSGGTRRRAQCVHSQNWRLPRPAELHVRLQTALEPAHDWNTLGGQDKDTQRPSWSPKCHKPIATTLAHHQTIQRPSLSFFSLVRVLRPRNLRVHARRHASSPQ